MARLIYSMLVSLDGYVEDAAGAFDWAHPDPEVHAYANELSAGVGTYLYGRRMYDTMVYWETASTEEPPVFAEFAGHWQAADKIIYSRTLTEPRSARTRIERELDLDTVRALKASATKDVAIAGPELAAPALRAGLVDEVQAMICPVVVGGGKRFYPEGVRLDLELREERRFRNGTLGVRYGVVGMPSK